MIENLKNTTSQLIEKYIDILAKNGEPDEVYKYLAISTFQKNWNLEADDFYQMFRTSFSKVSNLLYQNSWGFIEKSAQNFPEETREMFRNLYDESVEIAQRIKTFQVESEKLLPKVRQTLNRTNINAQQDERTISVYLAFRFPEKYMLYKADYYKNFCDQLNIKAKKSGERFLHLQELANQIIEESLLDDENFINTYRKFYQKPDWEDKYLMIQNILYVVFRDFKETDLVNLLKDFDRKDLEEYYEFLDKIIEKFGLQQNDQRLVFNFRNKKFIVFTIGQRYILRVNNSKSTELTFGAISTEGFTERYSNFDGNPKAYWNGTNTISEINNHQIKVFDAVEQVLNRTQISGYSKYNKKELEQMAFDVDFRNEILNQLDNQTTTEKPMEITKFDKKTPLNQILFGAPGTGKTYNTKRIAVEIINGKKARTREEINAEYENLVNAKQIVFTTFHQSLSYEDFIEGIKPETSDGNVTYEVKDGIFKSLCQNANPKNTVSFENAYEKLQQKLAENEIIELKTPTDKTFSITLNKNGNLSLMTGSKREKQGVLTKEKLLQQLNGKEVFIGWEGYFKGVINHLKSEFNFNPETTENTKNYVLIIDEINRGNVSAIFGELITLLEEDKRKGNKEQTEVTLPYSNDKFSVPNNVYVIGTMNTADRSVEALDTALRRRFSFTEMQPNPEILLDSEYRDVDLKKLLETINQRIEVLIDKDHQIGHSYFIGIQNLDDLKLVFKDKIIPLLEEYFYGDFGKIGLVLGGNFIFQEENTAKFPKNFTYENDFLEDKKVFRFTSFDNWNEQTFISVYED
ncbi:McrB family protein [Pedobacter sp. BS3]|uniref:McrB family protein n=1 Tax=Pedobacter sp. BS3 TaxID=2567937 RepID=UPI0011F09B91|nr:AAA family ATPase [Pedobacter sp. BS3]